MPGKLDRYLYLCDQRLSLGTKSGHLARDQTLHGIHDEREMIEQVRFAVGDCRRFIMKTV